MSRKTLFKALTGVGLVTTLLGSAVAANAGTGYTNFSTTVGSFGSAGYSNSQTKSATGKQGDLNVTFIGAGRTVSARMYRNSDGARGTERTGVSGNSTVTLPNSFGGGQTVRVEFAGNPTIRTSTQVDGRWRSN